MARRPMSNAEALQAWRVDGELHGHSPSQTIGFVAALMDAADEQEARVRALPAEAIPAAAEPRGWLRRWLRGMLLAGFGGRRER